ncbi:GNAT family N-acetyltransferase [Streptomyces sp. NPDC055060]
MSEIVLPVWPPAPIHAARVTLRESERGDRDGFVDLYASAEVRAYLGGPQPRGELERGMPEVPGRRPGVFVVAVDGVMIGSVQFDRRDAGRPGHVRPEGGEVELGYQFLPAAWGHGYAAEACRAALSWCADALPGEPVVLCTQVANRRSLCLAERLGFTEVERFDEFGARQWFGVLDPRAHFA